DKNLTVFAARGLCLMKDARAKDALVKHLSDEDTGARAAAANALGAIGSYLLSSKAPESDVEAFRIPLRAAFAEMQDENVLDNIAIALARMKEPLGKERLVALSKSEDAVARDNARRALEILTQPSL